MSHAATGPCNCGARGWMPGIEHRPIRWPRPAVIVREQGLMRPYVVVDHIMQGYLTTIDAWAVNGESKIITHFGIARNGRTVQYQDIYTEGVHTSAVNGPTARLVQQYGSVGGRGVNPYSISIEHEGFSVDPGYGHDYLYSQARPWPEPMVQASIAVKRWLHAQPDTNLGPPSPETIIGHYEADARNRINDPSPQHDRSIWPRARMIAALADLPAPPPAVDVSAIRGHLDTIDRESAAIRRLLEVK